MSLRYDRATDQMVGHNGMAGAYGHGMDGFVRDELELGARVALLLDDPEQAWWGLIGNDLLAREAATDERTVDWWADVELEEELGNASEADQRTV